MKKSFVSLASLVLVAVLSLAVGCRKSTGPNPSAKAPVPIRPVEPVPGAVGRTSSGRAALPAPSAGSPITDEQVRSFVLSHRVPGALQASNVAVVSTHFLTSEQMSNMLHTAKLGIKEEDPVCLVVMSGKFVFSGPPGPAPAFPIAVEVFDVRTGNLLQYGGLSRMPEPAVR
jgi:hypothetical protein